jgi:hypothetical protein
MQRATMVARLRSPPAILAAPLVALAGCVAVLGPVRWPRAPAMFGGPWRAWLAGPTAEGRIAVMLSTDRQLETLFGLALGEARRGGGGRRRRHDHDRHAKPTSEPARAGRRAILSFPRRTARWRSSRRWASMYAAKSLLSTSGSTRWSAPVVRKQTETARRRQRACNVRGAVPSCPCHWARRCPLRTMIFAAAVSGLFKASLQRVDMVRVLL